MRDLREDEDFCDVTLVCEDNQQIPGHKVVLAASSPLLRAMLKSSQHSHPLLYFWGVKARDLARLVDFIYRGQVQVYQSDLEDFLNVAKMLKVKGVTEGRERDNKVSRPEATVAHGMNEKFRAMIPHPTDSFLEESLEDISIVEEINTYQGVSQTNNITSPIMESFTKSVADEKVKACNKCGLEFKGESGAKSLENHLMVHLQMQEDSRKIMQGPPKEEYIHKEMGVETHVPDSGKFQRDFKKESLAMEPRAQKVRSPVWEWFNINQTDPRKAYCKLCQEEVIRGTLGTKREKLDNKRMKSHLKLNHINQHKTLVMALSKRHTSETTMKQNPEQKPMKTGSNILNNWYHIYETDPTKAYCKLCSQHSTCASDDNPTNYFISWMTVHWKSSHSLEYSRLIETFSIPQNHPNDNNIEEERRPDQKFRSMEQHLNKELSVDKEQPLTIGIPPVKVQVDEVGREEARKANVLKYFEEDETDPEILICQVRCAQTLMLVVQ